MTAGPQAIKRAEVPHENISIHQSYSLLAHVRRSALGPDELLARFVEAVGRKDGRGLLFSFINNFSYRVARQDSRFQHVDVFGADGLIFAFILRVLTGRAIRRVSFDTNSLALTVFEECRRRGLRLGVTGGSEAEVKAFGQKLAATMPDLCLAALVPGFGVTPKDVAHALREASADVAIFSMGSGRQEAYAAAALAEVPTLRAAFTSGAFVTQFSRAEAVGIYPQWVNHWNLRWAYRMVHEPHVRRRVLVDYPLSLMELAADLMLKR